MRRLVLLLPLFGAAGCSNPCQQLCAEMADYAKECGLNVDKDDILVCKDEFQGAELADEDRQTCEEWGDPDALREWWTCDDLAAEYGQGS